MNNKQVASKLNKMMEDDKNDFIERVNQDLNNIKDMGVSLKNISDGHHSFADLYEHRHRIFITLCKVIVRYNGTHLDEYGENAIESDIWRSKKHSDGSMFEGNFVMGIGTESGKQITYHLPLEYWDEVDFAVEREMAPEYDFHTPEDVLDRLKELI